MMPSRGYLLCSIERTGSNLLAQALAGTGIAGRPLEYFNAVEQQSSWIQDILQGSTIVEGLPKLLIAGATPNGIFGAKVHWNHFRHLGMSIRGEWSESERVAPYELLRSRLPNLLHPDAAHKLLESRFPDLHAQMAAYRLLQSFLPGLRLIWLQRKNMVARAISHFRARQTGRWYQSLSEPEIHPDSQSLPDLAEIHNLYCLGGFQQESWRRFFQEHDITVHCVFYEELAGNYERTVEGVLDFLAIGKYQATIPPPRSLKQSDALSIEWEERYREAQAKLPALQ